MADEQPNTPTPPPLPRIDWRRRSDLRELQRAIKSGRLTAPTVDLAAIASMLREVVADPATPRWVGRTANDVLATVLDAADLAAFRVDARPELSDATQQITGEKAARL